MFPTSSVSAAIQYSRHTFQVYFIANIHSEIRYKHSETRLFCSKPDCRNVLLNLLSCLVRLERHLHHNNLVPIYLQTPVYLTVKAPVRALITYDGRSC